MGTNENGHGHKLVKRLSDHDIGNPVLVYSLKPAGWYAAHVAPEKGGNRYLAQRMARNIKWFGYNRIVWQSDQEPSIIALRDLVQQYLGQAAMLEKNRKVKV